MKEAGTKFSWSIYVHYTGCPKKKEPLRDSSKSFEIFNQSSRTFNMIKCNQFGVRLQNFMTFWRKFWIWQPFCESISSFFFNKAFMTDFANYDVSRIPFLKRPSVPTRRGGEDDEGQPEPRRGLRPRPRPQLLVQIALPTHPHRNGTGSTFSLLRNLFFRLISS